MSDLVDLPGLLTPIAGVRPPSTMFGLVLLVHIPAGATAFINGLIAAASPKRRGRHPGAGRIYIVALSVVFVTASAMAAMRWSEDAYLFVLGSISFSLCLFGYTARRIRWRGWRTFHGSGMALSVVVLATAFYADNGPHFAAGVPVLIWWLGPSGVGLPLLIRALRRNTNPLDDLRQAAGPLTRV